MAEKRKAVVEDDSSADEDEATTAKCMSKKQAKVSNAETLLASKLNKSKTQIAYGGGLTTTKASKMKSVTKFRPEVGSAVWARLMMNKKNELPPRGGHGLSGRTFAGVATEVDHVNEWGIVKYISDGWIENKVRYIHMKKMD
eukprot:3296833-Pleurochrysis_carterae.AAC.1